MQRGIVVRVGHLSVANRALDGEGLSLELLCFARSWPWPRVAPGDFSPRAPTDPDVQYDRIRLFESGVCCPGVDAVHDPRRGKRVSGEQYKEARPC